MTGIESNRPRLFAGARIAIATSAARFIAITAIMAPLKSSFGLNNEQVGWIGGAGLWGFPVTMLIFGSLCDSIGMKLVLRLAVLAHLTGAVIVIFANGFAMLFIGSLFLSMGDGLVQAACNPLVVTLYADRKTEMINKLHLWFPGGMVICGLLVFFVNRFMADIWQTKLVLVLVPAAIYGAFFRGQEFPASERVQLGVSFGQMFRETFCRPLFLLLALCMAMTASVELGPNTWLTPMLESAGISGILVLVWISLLMALLRQLAGPMIHRVTLTGLLFCSALLSGLGLLGLSCAHSLWTSLAAGTIFAGGVAYFWPTMIGVTAEWVPKGGALALALMGGVGMAAVGLIATPMMGRVADGQIHTRLAVAKTVECLRRIADTYPALSSKAQDRSKNDIRKAIAAAQSALEIQLADNASVEPRSVVALRLAIAAAPESEAAKTAERLLGPAENYGGRVAFRWIAVLSAVLAVIFGGLFVKDRINSMKNGNSSAV